MLKNIFILLLFMPLINYTTENTIMLKVGQTAKIKLVSNPTTGYSWQLTQPLDKKAPITLEKTGFLKSKSKLIGAPTTQFWIFKAKKYGNIQITLEYKRPWETDRPATEVKTYTLKVK